MCIEQGSFSKLQTLQQAVAEGNGSLHAYLNEMSSMATGEQHIQEVFLPALDLVLYCQESLLTVQDIPDEFIRKAVKECILYLQTPLIQDDFENHEMRRAWKYQLSKYLIPQPGENTLSDDQKQIDEFRQFVVSDARSINNLGFLLTLSVDLPTNTLSEDERQQAQYYCSVIGRDGNYKTLTEEEKIFFVEEVKVFTQKIVAHYTGIPAFSGKLY